MKHKVFEVQNRRCFFRVFYWTIEGLVKAGKMEQLFDMAQKKTSYGYLVGLKDGF